MMAVSEAERFEVFLKGSFEEGINVRELRLSDQEVEFVKKNFPEASLKKQQMEDSSDGKFWFEITLSPSQINDEGNQDSLYIATIRKENERLKQELDLLRKTRNLTEY